ncbi:hypothetical protein ACFE04_008618 [Oxalis oulophora]
MDDSLSKVDLHVNVSKQQPFRQASTNNKSSLSGRSTPRNSPSFRRWNSRGTPRRDARITGGTIAQWFRSNRLVYWLLLITLWAYLGFHIQSRWAHDNKAEFSGFGGQPRQEISESHEQSPRRELTADQSSTSLLGANETTKSHVRDHKMPDVLLAQTGGDDIVSSRKKVPVKKKNKRAASRKLRVRRKATVKAELTEDEIPMKNSSYGLLVGPFGSIEDRVLEWSPEKRSGTCDRKGDFARLVWSRKFVLIFHELSMTGAPISMMELATEMLSCGATVNAVVLSKKGGLLSELSRRRIKVLEDRAELSFKTAMKADLVIAGSAVCASWIDKYMDHFPAGGSQIAWWIMENRREYFDRAKVVLDRVKMLVFLSELQTKQWLTWCEEEKIKLRSQPVIVPLSVNDDLTFVAGLPSSLNTPTFSTQKMLEKKQLLRASVRSKMGLADSDMLVMSLSSINPGKGQLLLLESAGLILEPESFKIKSKIKSSVNIGKEKNTLAERLHLRGLKSNFKDSVEVPAVSLDSSQTRRKVLSDSEGMPKQNLKILIGSVGSKSNKVEYVKEMLNFVSQHANLSKSVLWTPATTRVSSLYSAADVYVTNSQGIGETFGRVTIEAMAYGLPVLGTDAGGTKEIVDHNVTGLLHPLGRPGSHILTQNLRFFLENPSVRQQMGAEGRKKVEEVYLKRHMYKKFVQVMYRCMKP